MSEREGRDHEIEQALLDILQRQLEERGTGPIPYAELPEAWNRRAGGE